MIKAVLIFGGASFLLVASIGVLRMPDLFTRMPAAAKAGTPGIGCMLAVAVHMIGGGRVLGLAVFENRRHGVRLRRDSHRPQLPRAASEEEHVRPGSVSEPICPGLFETLPTEDILARSLQHAPSVPIGTCSAFNVMTSATSARSSMD